MCVNQWDCGGRRRGVGAQWGLTLRAGAEKQFQGQHGNITSSRYKAAGAVAKPGGRDGATPRTELPGSLGTPQGGGGGR